MKNNTMSLEEKMYYVFEYLNTNREFVNGAVMMGGWNINTVNRIIYYETGYQTFEDWYKEEGLDNE